MMQGSSELTELFDLESSEELLERFACALLQTYTCSHNDFTPEQQVGSGHAVNTTSDCKTSSLPHCHAGKQSIKCMKDTAETVLPTYAMYLVIAWAT